MFVAVLSTTLDRLLILFEFKQIYPLLFPRKISENYFDTFGRRGREIN